MTSDSGTRVAVVTGAASGIGAACVTQFREEGWLTAGLDLNLSDTDLALIVDVASREDVSRAMEQVVARFERIDVLVSAAGYYEQGMAFTDIAEAQLQRMLRVILGGTVNACAAVLPYMRERGSGSMVAIASELALTGSSMGDLHYVAAKGAVLGFTKSLAMEVADTAIRVNVVAPGATDTPLLGPDDVSRSEEYLASLPLGRLIRPEEVAGTVYFLCTDSENFCGEVLSPNAGAVI